MLLAEPEVRLLMRADGVDEKELLATLSAISRRLRMERRRAHGSADAEPARRRDSDPSKYRPGVGVMLLNRQGEVFVGRRVDVENAWQMPQGGIDSGESPLQAALRELKEEIGTDHVEVIAESKGWTYYDVPKNLSGKTWPNRWRGQRQKWFVMLFRGTDGEIDLATAHPEYDAWRWAARDELPRLAVSFKRRLYHNILREFDPILRDAGGR
jgi:putative (di)nucleoside polyphosphate hydrolase